jgi:pimeloyl-ACP methyl ester carboxylesterase
VKHFAGDIDPVQANVMYSVQQPLSASALGDIMGTPAWRSTRTWYAVARNDEAIPPDVERQFAKRMDATVIEVASGHLAMVSHPDEVADLVRTAARSLPS